MNPIDIKPFFDLVHPENASQELQNKLLKLFHEAGPGAGITKVADNCFSLTFYQDRELTYHHPLFGKIGTITIKKETTITVMPPENGHPKSEPDTVTDQRRVVFHLPVSVHLSGLFSGVVASVASDSYTNREGKLQSRFEVRTDGGLKQRLVAEMAADHFNRLEWV